MFRSVTIIRELVLGLAKVILLKMLLHVSVCDHHQGARTWA